MKNIKWAQAVKTMFHREYWNRANTIEFFAFFIKVLIIFPGLIFGIQLWWFYIFSLLTSTALIWSSTVKTLPTIILLNIAWIIISILAIYKNFFPW